MENLFLGYAIHRDEEADFPAASVAGNNFQLGFIEAWKRKSNLEVFSVLPTAAWPAERRLLISPQNMNSTSHLKINVIPFVNIRILKEFSIMFSTYRIIKRFCRKNKGKEINIISYNGNGPLSIPTLWLRKKYGYNYICMVVDPPLYQGTMNRSGIIWKFLYSRLSASFMRAASKCDVCVVLNAYFAEEYLKRQDYYVMDCGVEPDILRNVTNENKKYWDKDGNIHMVFTGILHEHSGILRFIEMFQKLRVSGMILHVFGKGIYEEQIKCIADKNPAVRYHGFVSSDTIRSIQQQADILVCPNTIEHPINKVAFPSKIQEYMLSGVPVLATAVNGLTEEYYEYLYIYDDTVQGLEAVLKKIIADSTETRKNKAYSAREFILKEKTWDKQVGKLMSYLEKKHEENQSRQMH